MNKFLMPSRIVCSQGVLDAENLFIDKPMQAGFANDGYTTLKKGGYILLDFGREIRGGIAICARSVSSFPKAASCRFVFGESVMEALSSIGEKNATNDHAIRDTLVDVPNMGNVFFGNTGFRFFKIEAVDSDVVIKSIKATLDTLDIEPVGSFECSDELLNEIWRVGAYTVYLNMGEYLWDGVKRDRLVWLGDMHPEAATIYAVYGNHPCIKSSLELIKSETPPSKWINEIPSYSFWWVINQYDWYMRTGDLDYLKEQEDYLIAIIERAYAISVDAPTDNFEFFVDWSSNSDEESKRVGFYSVMYTCFECGEKIAELLGSRALAWLCRDGKHNVKALGLEIPKQKQMAGIAAFSGLVSSVEANNRVLSIEPIKELSTFMGYYVLLARADAGDVVGALEVVREYWGAMLKLGATSFFEDFDIDWIENAGRIDEIVPEGKRDIHGDFGKFCYLGFRHSLCHGWASGPTAFLSSHVLGVQIVEAGCKRLRIKPNLAGLEWVRGAYPTPYGRVEIEHRMVDGKVRTEVRAPEGVEIELICD